MVKTIEASVGRQDGRKPALNLDDLSRFFSGQIQARSEHVWDMISTSWVEYQVLMSGICLKRELSNLQLQGSKL